MLGAACILPLVDVEHRVDHILDEEANSSGECGRVSPFVGGAPALTSTVRKAVQAFPTTAGAPPGATDVEPRLPPGDRERSRLAAFICESAEPTSLTLGFATRM